MQESHFSLRSHDRWGFACKAKDTCRGSADSWPFVHDVWGSVWMDRRSDDNDAIDPKRSAQ